MAPPIFVLLITALVFVCTPPSGVEAESWSDIKTCTKKRAATCHDSCATNLKSEAAMKKCREDYTSAFVDMESECLIKNGWAVNDTTSCWPIFNYKEGAATKATKPYWKCYRECEDKDAKLKPCRKNCKAPTDSAQLKATENCTPKLFESTDAYKASLKKLRSCIPRSAYISK